MEKLFLTLIGILVLTVLSSAQDLGRLRQIMMMRQREMALRRGFPFGVGPMRGPGIPPPRKIHFRVAARLALLERQRGGSGNIFGQQPTQAAEFLETNRGTVEPGPQMDNNARRHRQSSRNGFRPVNLRQNSRRQNGPMPRFRARQDNARDRPPMLRPRPPPEGLPPLRPLPLVAPNDAMQVRAPIPVPAQPAFVPINPQFMFPMPPPPGPRMPPRRRNRRRGPRRRRNHRPSAPRVFPNVPEIPQIPAAPSSQGQSNDGQQQGNIGFGQDGSGQANNQFGFNNQQGMPSGGDPRMGPNPFFPGGSRFPAAMGPGGAIFPSQAAQGPIMRQPGPGFSDASSTMFPGGPGGPNGPRPQPSRGGAFDQSRQFPFPGGEGLPGGFPGGEGRPGGFPGGMMFPGFPGPTFGGRPFGPGPGAPGQPFSGQPQFGSREQGGQMGGPGFGFVGPSSGGAGPAFSTNNQSPQDFNLQFRPLPNDRNVRPMPEMRPDQNQMGIGSMDAGFASGGMGQRDMQFGGNMENMGNMGNMGSQGGASQGNTLSGSTTNVVTTNMGSNQQTGGGMSFDTGNQASGLTVSDRTVNDNSGSNNNDGFRLVEVGNVVDKSGLMKPAVIDDVSNNMNTVTITETKTTRFTPTNDIGSAFESFGEVTSLDNIIDLNAAGSASSASNATVIESSGDVNVASGGAANEASGSVESTASGGFVSASSGSSDSSVSTSMSSSNVMPESPFASSMNKDFSFFMVDNAQPQPPIEMPAINVPVPPSNSAATDDVASNKPTDGFMNPFGVSDGFSKPLALEPLTINDISKEKGKAPSIPTDGFQAIFTEFLTSPGDGFTAISNGPHGTQTMSFPVTGTTANEATSGGGGQGFSFMTSSSSSTGSLDNSMGDLTMMGGNSMGEITLGETPSVTGDITAPATDNADGGFV